MSEFDVTPDFDATAEEVETPPEPRVSIGPDWFVYGDYIGSAEKGERQRIPYVPGMVLPEGQQPQPPDGRRIAYEGELPDEVEEVWGNGKTDDTGLPAINTARGLIGCWGIERFLGSAIHSLAKQEMGREARMTPFREQFLKEQAKRK